MAALVGARLVTEACTRGKLAQGKAIQIYIPFVLSVNCMLFPQVHIFRCIFNVKHCKRTVLL